MPKVTYGKHVRPARPPRRVKKKSASPVFVPGPNSVEVSRKIWLSLKGAETFGAPALVAIVFGAMPVWAALEAVKTLDEARKGREICAAVDDLQVRRGVCNPLFCDMTAYVVAMEETRIDDKAARICGQKRPDMRLRRMENKLAYIEQASP